MARMQPVDFNGAVFEAARQAKAEEAASELTQIAAMACAFDVPAVCRIPERVIKGAIIRTHADLDSRVVKTLPPKTDIVVVHRCLNTTGTLRLLIISPVHGYVSEKLVEHMMKIPDHKGEFKAEQFKKEQVKLKQERLWARPRGPKIPPAMAISRTLAFFNSRALALAADPPVEVRDPMRDMSPAGELLFKSLVTHKMKRDTSVSKMAAGRAHNGLRVLELGSGRGVDAVEMTASRLGVEFVGIDGSAGMCGLARERIDKRRIGFRCEVREQEYLQRAYFGEDGPGTFDGCIATSALQHVPWSLIEAVLSKVRRSLTKGGSLVVCEAAIARKSKKKTTCVEDDANDGPDRFSLSRDGEYVEKRTWVEWKDKIQKFFVLDRMIDYDVRDRRGRKTKVWAASWVVKEGAPDVAPPPQFVDVSRAVDPAELDEPIVEDMDLGPTSTSTSTHLDALAAIDAADAPPPPPPAKRPWPSEKPPAMDYEEAKRTVQGVQHVMKTSGQPTVEECAEYARAKAAIEDAEREHKKKYPDAPAAPERARAVPFGHLRVCHDASPFDNGDGGDADEDDGELGELEGGGFDISDEGALAVKKPKKRGFGGGFGRGFLN